MIYQSHDLIKESLELIKSQQFSNVEDLAEQLRAVYFELDEMERREQTKFFNKGLEDLKKVELLNTASKILTEPIVDMNDIIAKSVQEDYILCLEDMTKHKILKRYLKTQHNMTWEQYLAKHNLPKDYPSCCKSFSAMKSRTAKKWGLGKINRVKRKTLRLKKEENQLF